MAGSSDIEITSAQGRREFLLKMYHQMFADINRHIMVVWQSLGVLLGGIALFALVEKQILTLDWACSVFVIIAGWCVWHTLEAGYWYNRNLAIIANIERQFLRKEDLKEIHYYFGSHRPNNKLLDQLRLQILFVCLVSAVFLFYHFYTRVHQDCTALYPVSSGLEDYPTFSDCSSFLGPCC